MTYLITYYAADGHWVAKLDIEAETLRDALRQMSEVISDWPKPSSRITIEARK